MQAQEPIASPQSDRDEMLTSLQQDSFAYFIHETNPANGLVRDKSRPGWPASIAAVGLALAAYPIGVERGFMSREEAVKRTLTTLKFFADAPHSATSDATGYKGFYYHFLDMNTGRRAWSCELSSVDTAFLIAGVLVAKELPQTPGCHCDGVWRIRRGWCCLRTTVGGRKKGRKNHH